MSCNKIVCKLNKNIFSMYISYVKLVMEDQYINQHILSIDFRFSTFHIPQIVCFALKNTRFSNLQMPNFQLQTFRILEILCSMFSNKKHHMFQFPMPQFPGCDISNIRSFIFSNKKMSKFLFAIFDLQVLEIEKLQFC